MHSSGQFILKSPIITFCSEECWPRIVRRPESKRGIGTWGERYSVIIVKSRCLSVLMIVNSIPSMLCANGYPSLKGIRLYTAVPPHGRPDPDESELPFRNSV